MTTLNDIQQTAVRSWLQAGLQLAEIQKRLAAEFDLRLTYMELKMVVSDLAVLPQDQEPTKTLELPAATDPRAGSPARPAPLPPPPPSPAPVPTPDGTATPGGLPGVSKVVVSVDQIARPGALASGSVQFSDGKRGGWYLDETGRLGLVAPEPGYRPPPTDVPAFQAALERELARIGF